MVKYALETFTARNKKFAEIHQKICWNGDAVIIDRQNTHTDIYVYVLCLMYSRAESRQLCDALKHGHIILWNV